jgi:hypothetical protein
MTKGFKLEEDQLLPYLHLNMKQLSIEVLRKVKRDLVHRIQGSI